MKPEIIHCCWMGDSPKNALARKCVESWRHYESGVEIREWNDKSIGQLCLALSGKPEPPRFVRDALSSRKWAFAADWVRFAALYLYGGVYFDFDFELLRPIDELAGEGGFVAGQWMPNGSIGLEPAILSLEKGSPVAKAMLDYYAGASFDASVTAGEILLAQLKKANLRLHVFPPEILSPIDQQGVCHRTERTVGIHHYAMSWATPRRRLARWMSWHGLHGIVRTLLRLTGRVR